MNRIVPIHLGASPFFLSFRKEACTEEWHMYHAHQGCEILYVEEGNGSVTVESKTYPLKAGMLFFFQPYQLHQVTVPACENAYYVRTNLTFDPRYVEPYIAPFPKLQQFLRRLWKGMLNQQVFYLKDDNRLLELLREMEQSRHLWEEEPKDEEGALSLLLVIRHLQRYVFPHENVESHMPGKVLGHVEQIADWIEAHYREPFSLSKLAEVCHLSPYHVSHLFKQYTGTSITEYITTLRIREACALLASTDKQVGDIGREVGRLGTSYFCQLFKRHKGVTPQAYRSMVRKVYER